MKNVIIAGVGGQGTLFASMVFGEIALELGLDVKLSEVHGMAQRGGSVVTYVRMGEPGEKVFAPVIDLCGADYLLAFEQLEAIRWLPYLKRDAQVFLNVQKIAPMPVITGAAQYPQSIPEKISKEFPNAVVVDALALAQQAGSVKAVNTVLLGVMAAHTDIDAAVWKNAIRKVVKPQFAELNEKAFQLGYEAK